MTKPLYYETDSLSQIVHVLTCAPYDEKFVVTLDQTIFHPQGGGQLSDIGYIGEAKVLKVTKSGDQILHVTDAEIPLGEAKIVVDGAVRKLHSILHSAGHLIGHIGMENSLVPTKAHHWPNECRVVFDLPEDTEKYNVDFFQAAVDDVLPQKLARECTWDGEIRLISFSGFPPFPCGGTHVSTLDEIKEIKILSVKTKSNGLVVSYDAK